MKSLRVPFGLLIAIASQFANAAEDGASGVASWNLDFGIGVEFYDAPYIEEATLAGEDKIVTMTKSYDTRPAAWLSVAWNIWGGTRDDGNFSVFRVAEQTESIKYGFFAGVKLFGSDNQSFDAFAIGPQVTFETGTRDISIGLGWMTNRNRRFAIDIEPGEPLPARYDDIGYEEYSQDGVLLMFSIAL